MSGSPHLAGKMEEDGCLEALEAGSLREDGCLEALEAGRWMSGSLEAGSLREDGCLKAFRRAPPEAKRRGAARESNRHAFLPV